MPDGRNVQGPRQAYSQTIGMRGVGTDGQGPHTSHTTQLKEPLNQPTRQVGGLRIPAVLAPQLSSWLE